MGRTSSARAVLMTAAAVVAAMLVLSSCGFIVRQEAVSTVTTTLPPIVIGAPPAPGDTGGNPLRPVPTAPTLPYSTTTTAPGAGPPSDPITINAGLRPSELSPICAAIEDAVRKGEAIGELGVNTYFDSEVAEPLVTTLADAVEVVSTMAQGAQRGILEEFVRSARELVRKMQSADSANEAEQLYFVYIQSFAGPVTVLTELATSQCTYITR